MPIPGTPTTLEGDHLVIVNGLSRDDAANLLVDQYAATDLFTAGSALNVADGNDNGLYEYHFNHKAVGIVSMYAHPGSITRPTYTLFIVSGVI